MATGKRSCTDVACCLFFLLFVGGLVAVAYLGLSSGDVSQLDLDGALAALADRLPVFDVLSLF